MLRQHYIVFTFSNIYRPQAFISEILKIITLSYRFLVAEFQNIFLTVDRAELPDPTTYRQIKFTDIR